MGQVEVHETVLHTRCSKADRRLRQVKKVLLLVSLVAAAGLCLVVRASADYGNTAVYQIELSANIPGHQGGGVWLWLELSSNGTVDYHGADCGRGGAVSDGGSTTWSDVGGSLLIPNVVLNGLGGFPARVTVPDTYGHRTGTVGSFITLPGFIPPGIGFSQLQVAP